MYNPYVRCIKKGETRESAVLFSDLRAGDRVKIQRWPIGRITVGEDAFQTTDTPRRQWMLYDNFEEPWFPDDVERAWVR